MTLSMILSSASPHESRFPSPPDPAPSLEPGEVHVWSVALDRIPPAADRTLSPDERQRMERFRSPVHGRRFGASRHALRSILASYSGIAAKDLRIEYGRYGKPAVRGLPFDFNLSHTGDLALAAVSAAGPVGVDVEQIRPSSSLERLARRVLAPAEREQLFRLSAAERPQAFFLAWTRKEALVKMLGEGVFTGLRRLQVTLLPGETARVVAYDPADSGHDSRSWRLHDLQPWPDVAAAVAVDLSGDRVVGDGVTRVRTWHWGEAPLEAGTAKVGP